MGNEEDRSADEETIQAGFSTPRSTHAISAFNSQASPVQRKSQAVKRATEESLVFSQVRSPSRKSIRAYLSEKDACVQILQEVRSLAKKVKGQTSYIKELEKNVDSLTMLVEKREKPADVATKKMGTMASRFTAFAATYPGRNNAVTNNASNSQAPQSTQQKDESQTCSRPAFSVL